MSAPDTKAGLVRSATNNAETRVARLVIFLVSITSLVGFLGLSAANSQETIVKAQSGNLEKSNSDNGSRESHSADSETGRDSVEQPDEVGNAEQGPWRPLLDEQLSLWEVFTGVPHKSVKIEGFPQSDSEDCRTGKPFGLGDPKNVYSVKLVDGKPVMYVTGELYAGLTSKEEFENYHFSTEFKWGEKKWPPRKHVKRDSGILIHCTGKHGAFWNVWMRCLECQVQEGDCGDFIQLAGTSCQLRATPETAEKLTPTHSSDGDWCTIGPGVGKWGAKHQGDHEIEGDWNRIEVFAVGDKAVFSVNGHPVMYLKNTRLGKFDKGKKLTKGKIQIQSEAAEIWYRDMKIREITTLPKNLLAHYLD